MVQGVSALLIALLLIVRPAEQGLPDHGLRPPVVSDVTAAVQRDRRRLPVIVRICRDAVATGKVDDALKRFADANGLSTFGLLGLTMNCRLYQQGREDNRSRR